MLYLFAKKKRVRSSRDLLKNRHVGYSQRVLQIPVLFSTRRHAAGKLQKMAR